jgi:hypothetical protein
MRDSVEGLAEDLLFVPVDEPQNRLGEGLDLRELVGLDSKDVPRRNSGVQEVLQDVQLGSRLPDLAGPAHDHGRGEAKPEAEMDLLYQMAPGDGKSREGVASPPRVHTPQALD